MKEHAIYELLTKLKMLQNEAIHLIVHLSTLQSGNYYDVHIIIIYLCMQIMLTNIQETFQKKISEVKAEFGENIEEMFSHW